MANEFAPLADKLHALAGDKMRQIQRKALKRVGEIVQTAVVEGAPEKDEGEGGLLKPGELKGSIRARVHIASDTEIVEGKQSRVSIGPAGETAKLVANWVNNGHTARRPKGFAKRGTRLGPPKFVPANPFVQRAFDAVQQQAIDAYTASVKADVDEAMK